MPHIDQSLAMGCLGSRVTSWGMKALVLRGVLGGAPQYLPQKTFQRGDAYAPT